MHASNYLSQHQTTRKGIFQAYFKRFNAGATGVRGSIYKTLKNFIIVVLRVENDFWKHFQGKELSTLASLYAKV